MPFKDANEAREWRRNHKAKLRELAKLLGDDAPHRRGPLHVSLGIRTYVHRQAVLDDPRLGRRYDPVNRVWNSQHNYRENVTLAKVFA